MNNKLFFLSLFLLGAAYAPAQTSRGFLKATQFIPKDTTQLFLGSVLTPESLNNAPYSFDASPYSSITIRFTSLNAEPISILPTRARMIEAIRQTLAKSKHEPGLLHVSSRVSPVPDYSILRMVYGQLFGENEALARIANRKKTHKTLCMVSLSLALYDATIDIPVPPAGSSSDKRLYINSMTFGKQVIAFVESDADSETLTAAIKNALNTTNDKDKDKEKPLDPSSSHILSNAAIQIILIGEPQTLVSHADNPLKKLVEYMKDKVVPADYERVIKFSAAYISDNTIYQNEY